VVAILLPVHAGVNAGHFDESLASVRQQTYSNIRIFLFCDGALTAAHEAAIARHLRPTAGDAVVRSELSVGLPTGLNRLIDEALLQQDVGFLARMDADDLSTAERIAEQLAYLDSEPDVDVVGTWCIEFIDAGVALFHKRLPVSRAEVLDFMVCRSPMAHPTVMFRRRVLDAGHRYDPRLTQMQDYELWSRLVRAGLVISNVPKYLLWYRISGDFFKRRNGLRRAFTEVRMRVRFARAMGLLRPTHVPKLFALFMSRIAPERLKYLAYMRMR
jgi:glycosyltransferase involved in cell wall biosynthesis